MVAIASMQAATMCFFMGMIYKQNRDNPISNTLLQEIDKQALNRKR